MPSRLSNSSAFSTFRSSLMRRTFPAPLHGESWWIRSNRSLPGSWAMAMGHGTLSLVNVRVTRYGSGGVGGPATRQGVHGKRLSVAEGLVAGAGVFGFFVAAGGYPQPHPAG